MQLSLFSLFGILLLLILLSAFFSASEIGMMSLNRYRLKHLVKKKNKNAIRVYALLQRPDKLLSVLLIGNTVANIIASMVATLIGQRLSGDVGVAIATGTVTFVVLVFSEMLPKTFAALDAQRVGFAVSIPLKYMQAIFAPFVYLVMWMSNGLLRLSGVRLDKQQRDILTGEELRSVVNEAGVLLPMEHKSMIISLLDLEEATVEDIMIPKAEIIGIDVQETWFNIVNQLETAQHTRLPLFEGSIDALIGVVHVRDLMQALFQNKLDKAYLIQLAEKPYYIPEGTPLNGQILNFQKVKKRSCFVVNEYGELQGLVTLEDILEEVVGEFTTDIAALTKDIVPEDDGSYVIDASITLRQLKRLLSWQLPDLGPRTLSGVIIEHLGYIPPADCCLKMMGYQIDILKVSDNMVKTVRMRVG